MKMKILWTILLSTCLLAPWSAQAFSITSFTVDMTECGSGSFGHLRLSGPGLAVGGGDGGVCGEVQPAGLHVGDVFTAHFHAVHNVYGMVDGMVVDFPPNDLDSYFNLDWGASISGVVPVNLDSQIVVIGSGVWSASYQLLLEQEPESLFTRGFIEGSGLGTAVLSHFLCQGGLHCFSLMSGTVEFPIVPEPSTWLLFGSGLVGLAAWRRKQAA